MKRTTYQVPELRDENDNIIQAGTYGKTSPLVNSDNTGVLDYINNNLMYLYNNTMGGTGGERRGNQHRKDYRQDGNHYQSDGNDG